MSQQERNKKPSNIISQLAAYVKKGLLLRKEAGFPLIVGGILLLFTTAGVYPVSCTRNEEAFVGEAKAIVDKQEDGDGDDKLVVMAVPLGTEGKLPGAVATVPSPSPVYDARRNPVRSPQPPPAGTAKPADVDTKPTAPGPQPPSGASQPSPLQQRAGGPMTHGGRPSVTTQIPHQTSSPEGEPKSANPRLEAPTSGESVGRAAGQEGKADPGLGGDAMGAPPGDGDGAGVAPDEAPQAPEEEAKKKEEESDDATSVEEGDSDDEDDSDEDDADDGDSLVDEEDDEDDSDEDDSDDRDSVAGGEDGEQGNGGAHTAVDGDSPDVTPGAAPQASGGEEAKKKEEESDDATSVEEGDSDDEEDDEDDSDEDDSDDRDSVAGGEDGKKGNGGAHTAVNGHSPDVTPSAAPQASGREEPATTASPLEQLRAAKEAAQKLTAAQKTLATRAASAQERDQAKKTALARHREAQEASQKVQNTLTEAQGKLESADTAIKAKNGVQARVSARRAEKAVKKANAQHKEAQQELTKAQREANRVQREAAQAQKELGQARAAAQNAAQAVKAKAEELGYQVQDWPERSNTLTLNGITMTLRTINGASTATHSTTEGIKSRSGAENRTLGTPLVVSSAGTPQLQRTSNVCVEFSEGGARDYNAFYDKEEGISIAEAPVIFLGTSRNLVSRERWLGAFLIETPEDQENIVVMLPTLSLGR